jgi:Pectate lyase superfamily protein
MTSAAQAPTKRAAPDHFAANNTPDTHKPELPTAKVNARAFPPTPAEVLCIQANEHINVMQFGARGDGRADDTAAFRAAISHAFDTGRSVYAPAGCYLITETLELSHKYSPNGKDLANNVTAITLTGDGPHSTYLLWASRVPMSSAKKPMIFLQGFVGLRRLALVGGRKYLGDAYHTPFYGVLGNGTFWRNVLEEVDIRYAGVCFSGGVACRFSRSGKHGFEIDPPTGGTAMTVDFAQMQLRNCVFHSEVIEFSDGSLDPLAALDSGGQRLLSQCFAFEAARQQSVNIEFDTCSFENANDHALYTLQLNNAGDIQFSNSLLSAPSVAQQHTYAIHEQCDSGGSNIYLDHCYLMGGIAMLTTTQGVLRIRKCNGENVVADVAYKGVVDLINIGGLGTTVDIDGLDIGRGCFDKQLTLSSAVQQPDATTNPAANTSAAFDHRLYSLRNITGVAAVICGHETFALSARTECAPSLVSDYASAIGVRHLPVSYLSDDSFDAESLIGFASPVQRGGRWLYGASLDTANSMAWFIPVDPTTCYDFSADVFVQLRAAAVPAGGDVGVQVTFHDASKRRIGEGVNAGVFLLGGVSPTNGYGFIQNARTSTIYSQHIVPPARAAFARVELTARPSSSQYLVAALGNVLFGPSGALYIVPVVAVPTFSAPSMPARGTWTQGDFVWNSASGHGRPVPGIGEGVLGWIRATSSNANVSGIDWLALSRASSA